MDVRLGRALTNSYTEFRAANIGARFAGDLPFLSQVIDGFDGDDGDVKLVARFDLFFHRSGRMELHRQRMSDGALTLRLELFHGSFHTIGNQNANRGRLSGRIWHTEE